jgi:hypothetical protein
MELVSKLFDTPSYTHDNKKIHMAVIIFHFTHFLAMHLCVRQLPFILVKLYYLKAGNWKWVSALSKLLCDTERSADFVSFCYFSACLYRIYTARN